MLDKQCQYKPPERWRFVRILVFAFCLGDPSRLQHHSSIGSNRRTRSAEADLQYNMVCLSYGRRRFAHADSARAVYTRHG